jgi:hypothetical protein
MTYDEAAWSATSDEANPRFEAAGMIESSGAQS